MTFNRKQFFLLILTVASIGFMASAKSATKSLENQIIKEFQLELDEIVEFAEKNPNPVSFEVLMGFIDSNLMERWSSELTIRAILGHEIWGKLSTYEQKELIESYTNTMRRYLYETFQQYNGQKPIADKVQLNKKMNKGWLTVRLILDNFPDISVDLKLYHYKNQWVIYDFRFQGISFVKLKTVEYREFIEKNSTDALVKILNDKYKLFKGSLKTMQ